MKIPPHIQIPSKWMEGEDLEKVRAAGEMLEIHVLNLASIADDVTPVRAIA